jgi:hypothetical protein
LKENHHPKHLLQYNYLLHLPSILKTQDKMRSFTVAAAFAAMAVANPVPQPQGFDWKAIDALSAIPTVTIPVVDVAAKASTVAFDASAAASSIAAVVKSSGVDSTASSGLKVRAAAVTCKAQPLGAGPTVSPDTPEAFLAYDYFKAQAVAAPTPGGYYNAFTNLQASNNAYGYMGYTLLNEYSTQACAAKCDAISGCASFNIYFERDPTKNPDDASCNNPSSTTNIKVNDINSPSPLRPMLTRFQSVYSGEVP